jgi:S-(hydroxymethyl)glutathione dehydrogenase / alcohol dehydrogenase
MKAALLVEHGKPLELAELEPEPMSYGQVLVKVLASGICGAQLQEIDGHKMGGPLPHPLGHEACVEVVEVGPAVRQVKAGDRCVAHWRKGDGIESEFPRYRYHDRIITGGKVTTFSDMSVCSENRLTPVPKDTPVELCALLGCGLSTALGTIEQEANLKMGESVMIIGCGGLGLNLILASKMRRASSIIGMDISSEKTIPVLQLGARFELSGIAPHRETFDVVIDTTGNPEAMDSGLSRLAKSGRFIMVGQPRPNSSVKLPDMFEGEGKTIKATQGGMFNPARDVPRYVRLHQAGLLNLDGIISHRVVLSDINQGIQLVRDGLAGRVLIEP